MLFAGRVLSGFICIEPAGYSADDALAWIIWPNTGHHVHG
jgi:hypothetical protein